MVITTSDYHLQCHSQCCQPVSDLQCCFEGFSGTNVWEGGRRSCTTALGSLNWLALVADLFPICHTSCGDGGTINVEDIG